MQGIRDALDEGRFTEFYEKYVDIVDQKRVD